MILVREQRSGQFLDVSLPQKSRPVLMKTVTPLKGHLLLPCSLCKVLRIFISWEKSLSFTHSKNYHMVAQQENSELASVRERGSPHRTAWQVSSIFHAGCCRVLRMTSYPELLSVWHHTFWKNVVCLKITPQSSSQNVRYLSAVCK